MFCRASIDTCLFACSRFRTSALRRGIRRRPDLSGTPTAAPRRGRYLPIGYARAGEIIRESFGKKLQRRVNLLTERIYYVKFV